MTRPPDALQRLRRVHEDLVLGTLRATGPLSRADIVERTGLSRTTLFAIIADLVRRGAVTEAEARPSGARGRPPTLVALAPEAGQLIGLDLARRRVHLAVANVAHQVVATGTADVSERADAAERAETAVRLIRRVIGERGIGLGSLEAIGLGLHGVVDEPARPAGEGANPAAERLAAEFGVRVAVDNNARLAALAESTWGAAKAVSDLVYVRWSTGIGGGYVVGGRLVRGAHGGAGELGHVSLDPGGPICHCGGRGCLEERAGGQALLEACAARGVAVAGLDELVEAARDRVPEVCALITAAATRIGRVLAGTVVQLDPRRVVLGGELGALGSLVLDPVRAEISRLALPNAAHSLDVVSADLGGNASAMGAIALLLQEDPDIPDHLRPAPSPA